MAELIYDNFSGWPTTKFTATHDNWDNIPSDWGLFATLEDSVDSETPEFGSFDFQQLSGERLQITKPGSQWGFSTLAPQSGGDLVAGDGWVEVLMRIAPTSGFWSDMRHVIHFTQGSIDDVVDGGKGFTYPTQDYVKLSISFEAGQSQVDYIDNNGNEQLHTMSLTLIDGGTTQSTWVRARLDEDGSIKWKGWVGGPDDLGLEPTEWTHELPIAKPYPNPSAGISATFNTNPIYHEAYVITATEPRSLLYSDRGMAVVEHGDDANTPRPPGAGAVYWVGSVAPANKEPHDIVDQAGNDSSGDGGSGSDGGGAFVVTVAASDAPDSVKAAADFVCSGANDEATIQAGIESLEREIDLSVLDPSLDAVPQAGGVLQLSEGSFIIENPIEATNQWYYENNGMVGVEVQTVVAGVASGGVGAGNSGETSTILYMVNSTLFHEDFHPSLLLLENLTFKGHPFEAYTVSTEIILGTDNSDHFSPVLTLDNCYFSNEHELTIIGPTVLTMKNTRVQHMKTMGVQGLFNIEDCWIQGTADKGLFINTRDSGFTDVKMRGVVFGASNAVLRFEEQTGGNIQFEATACELQGIQAHANSASLSTSSIVRECTVNSTYTNLDINGTLRFHNCLFRGSTTTFDLSGTKRFRFCIFDRAQGAPIFNQLSGVTNIIQCELNQSGTGTFDPVITLQNDVNSLTLVGNTIRTNADPYIDDQSASGTIHDHGNVVWF